MEQSSPYSVVSYFLEYFGKDVTEIINGFSLLSIVIIAVLLLLLMKMRREKNICLNALLRLKRALGVSPVPWCMWEDGDYEGIQFSPSLPETLHCPPRELSLTGILELFHKHAKSFKKDLEALVHDGEPFSTVMTHQNEDDVFLVTGTSVNSPMGDSYMLWFQDITTQVRNEQVQTEVNFQLEEERDSLKELLDLVPVSVWMKSSDKNILFCNKAYADVLETTPELVVTEKKLITTWRKNHLGVNITKEVLSKREPVTQLSHAVINGERRLLSITEQLSSNDCIIGYAIDQTELDVAKERVESIRRLIQDALERLPNPIITFSSNYRVEFFNQAYVQMFKHDAKWLLGHPTYNELIEDLRERRMLPEMGDFQGYKRERMKLFSTLMEPQEETLYYPDGRAIRMITAPYHDNGLMLVFHDVSEWLSLERRYNTLLAVHKQILDNLFEGASVYASNNKLTLFNKAFAQLWNFDEEELNTGPHLNDIIDKIHPQLSVSGDWEKFKERIFRKVTSREPIREGRVLLKGEKVYDFAQTPLPDGSNLLTFLDVTDRFKIEKALLERNEALEVADKIKSDFINKIYTSIQAPLLELSEGVVEIDRYDDKSVQIHDAVNSIKQRVEEFYQLANVSFGDVVIEASPVKAVTFINELYKKHKKEADEKNICFKVEEGVEKNVLIEIDTKKLHQAFYSLFKNAFIYNKFKNVFLKSYAKDGRVYIIIDCDEYIPFADLSNKSRKLKKGVSYNVLGVGYSLVRHFVELHKGTLTFENNKKDGTSIIVNLPETEK